MWPFHPSPARRAARTSRGAGSARAQRGVALLIVIISITLLALMASEFAYNSRVDLQLATNQRDEIRAYYLARSGIGLSRLLLKFQKQVDAIQIPNIAQLLGGAGGLGKLLGGGGEAPGTPPAQPSTLNIQLWRMAKVDCNMLSAMVVEEDPKHPSPRPPPRSKKFEFDDEAPELAEKQKARNFGGFEGC